MSPAAAVVWCDPAHAAVDILGPPSPSNLTAGERFTVQFEFKVANFTPMDNNLTVYFPGIFAKFPELGGSNLTFFFLPRAIDVAGNSWTNVSLASLTKLISQPVSFASGGRPDLTSEILAVMANAPYGALNLSLHWRWIVTPVTGSNITSPWSYLVRYGIHPVPYVQITPTFPAGSTEYLGTRWTATLVGATSNQQFYLELENASTGIVVNKRWETAPSGNGTPFIAMLPLTSVTDNLTTPGTLLMHIHDYCRAILSNTVIHVVYAPSARLQIVSDLAACPSVSFNGVEYLNGTKLTVLPSPTAYPISAGTCTGHAFTGWATTGVLHLSNPLLGNSTLLVTYNGTLVADWH